jgi:hypothetical protein
MNSKGQFVTAPNSLFTPDSPYSLLDSHVE